MALYILACFDKANSLDLRLATREAHLAWAGAQADRIRRAGPMLSEDDTMAGSLFFLDAESAEDVRAFNAADPYTKAGLFDRVEIQRFRPTLGEPL
ncbi:MAG: YciI family protein [Phenylobacterium sp.]